MFEHDLCGGVEPEVSLGFAVGDEGSVNEIEDTHVAIDVVERVAINDERTKDEVTRFGAFVPKRRGDCQSFAFMSEVTDDAHAMIYTEDAPKLENELQRRFADHQVNLVNNRKEFFRVSLEHIEAVVKDIHGHISFVRTAAAEEFRKSQALRKRRTQQLNAHQSHQQQAAQSQQG